MNVSLRSLKTALRLLVAAIGLVLLGPATAQTQPGTATQMQGAGQAAQPGMPQAPGTGGQSQAGQAQPGASSPGGQQMTLPTTGTPGATLNTVPSGVLPTAGPPPPLLVQFPPAIVTATDGTMAPLYGAGLFTGAFAGSTISTRPDYVIQVGDTINVLTFGNMSLNVTGRINTDGKLFLPIIGPVTLAGVTRGGLNGVLQAAVGTVYTNTRVYADIVQPGAVGVFVTGNIQRPGRYLGSSADDLLYFLDKAGGIDGPRGSFRDVVVRRADGREQHFDLYDFLTKGMTAPTRFADGDVIVVKPRGPQVVVTGLALNPFAFELKLPPGGDSAADSQHTLAASIPDAGEQILTLARPNTRTLTGAYVRSVRDQQPVSAYLPYRQFAGVALGDGDHVDFRSDAFATTIAVSLKVQQTIPSVFIVPRTATLQDVLGQIPHASPTADYGAAYILRHSVALQQKELLNAALLRLQQDAYAATALSPSASSAASASASLVPQFIAAASQVVPTGQIAVYRDGRFDNIRLEDGDQIVIPEKSDVVLVGGEALNPGAFAHRPGARVSDYINDAGGFSVAANRHKFVLREPNGVARVVDRKAVPGPGDQILIVPAVRGQTFQLIKDISTLVFQLALTTATVLQI